MKTKKQTSKRRRSKYRPVNRTWEPIRSLYDAFGLFAGWAEFPEFLAWRVMR